MKKINLTYIFLIIITLISCRKDSESTVIVKEEKEDPRIIHDTNLIGTVKNEQGEPISGVKVIVGSNQATTDNEGYYNFTDIKAYADGTVVSFEAEGYTPAIVGVRTASMITTMADAEMQALKTQLWDKDGITRNLNYSIQSYNDKLEYLDGKPLSGEAFIVLSNLNGFSSDILGQDKYLNRGRIEQYKGFQVWAFDKDGLPLRIKNNELIELVINDSTIPPSSLFDLDTEEHLWSEISTVVSNAEGVTVSLKSFGYKMLGGLISTSNVSGVLNYLDGTVAPFTSITLKNPRGSKEFTTDRKGAFSLELPFNERYELLVEDLCGNINTVMVFDTDDDYINLTDVTIDKLPLTFRFGVLDCEFTEVENLTGFSVLVNGNDKYTFSPAEGKFDIILNPCGDFVDLSVMSGNQVYTQERVQVSPLTTVANYLPYIVACDENVGASIEIDGEYSVIEADRFYILDVSKNGQIVTEFSDLTDFTVTSNISSGVGEYQVVDFNNVIPNVECVDCPDLKLFVHNFGLNGGERISAFLQGNIEGKPVKAYFNDLKFK